MSTLDRPFVGSEAIAEGLLRKHELRSRYRTVFPDVYVPNGVELTLERRARAGWLWSHRQGVISGHTASALHGAKWVDADAPVELVWPNARPARGLRTYDYRLRTEEFAELDGMRVTTPARTGFDIGRRRPLATAIANLDALGNATGLAASDVFHAARKHRGSRGLRQLAKVIGADYPRPRTQIPVLSADCRRRYYLDMVGST